MALWKMRRNSRVRMWFHWFGLIKWICIERRAQLRTRHFIVVYRDSQLLFMIVSNTRILPKRRTRCWMGSWQHRTHLSDTAIVFTVHHNYYFGKTLPLPFRLRISSKSINLRLWSSHNTTISVNYDYVTLCNRSFRMRHLCISFSLFSPWAWTVGDFSRHGTDHLVNSFLTNQMSWARTVHLTVFLCFGLSTVNNAKGNEKLIGTITRTKKSFLTRWSGRVDHLWSVANVNEFLIWSDGFFNTTLWSILGSPSIFL